MNVLSNKTFVSIYTTCNLVMSNRWESSVQILLYKISVDAIPPFHRNSPAFSPVSSVESTDTNREERKQKYLELSEVV